MRRFARDTPDTDQKQLQWNATGETVNGRYTHRRGWYGVFGSPGVPRCAKQPFQGLLRGWLEGVEGLGGGG